MNNSNWPYFYFNMYLDIYAHKYRDRVVKAGKVNNSILFLFLPPHTTLSVFISSVRLSHVTVSSLGDYCSNTIIFSWPILFFSLCYFYFQSALILEIFTRVLNLKTSYAISATTKLQTPAGWETTPTSSTLASESLVPSVTKSWPILAVWQYTWQTSSRASLTPVQSVSLLVVLRVVLRDMSSLYTRAYGTHVISVIFWPRRCIIWGSTGGGSTILKCRPQHRIMLVTQGKNTHEKKNSTKQRFISWIWTNQRRLPMILCLSVWCLWLFFFFRVLNKWSTEYVTTLNLLAAYEDM